MSTYKDTDALVELIDHYILYDKDAYKNHSALFIDGMKDGYYRIRSNIINMPSADVIEVVHGKWIKGVCDKCGFDWGKIVPIASVPNYCPNCGARMGL